MLNRTTRATLVQDDDKSVLATPSELQLSSVIQSQFYLASILEQQVCTHVIVYYQWWKQSCDDEAVLEQ